jgi:hypothetical protein
MREGGVEVVHKTVMWHADARNRSARLSSRASYTC